MAKGSSVKRQTKSNFSSIEPARNGAAAPKLTKKPVSQSVPTAYASEIVQKHTDDKIVSKTSTPEPATVSVSTESIAPAKVSKTKRAEPRLAASKATTIAVQAKGGKTTVKPANKASSSRGETTSNSTTNNEKGSARAKAVKPISGPTGEGLQKVVPELHLGGLKSESETAPIVAKRARKVAAVAEKPLALSQKTGVTTRAQADPRPTSSVLPAGRQPIEVTTSTTNTSTKKSLPKLAIAKAAKTVPAKTTGRKNNTAAGV